MQNVRAYCTAVSILHCSIPVQMTISLNETVKMTGNFPGENGALFHGFTDNTCGHFTHCLYLQFVKYSHLLSVKPSNEMHVVSGIDIVLSDLHLQLFAHHFSAQC